MLTQLQFCASILRACDSRTF